MRILLFISFFVLISACQQHNGADNTVVDNSRTLVTIDDQPITEQMVRVFWLNQGVDQPNETQISEAIKQLTEQQLLVNYAKKQGITLSLEQTIGYQQIKQKALAQQALQQYLIDNPITEADMKAEYERVIKEVKDQQFHVRHLLFKDEIDALAALDELAAGTDYAKLEQAYLQSHGQMSNVGDIGWVNIKQVPESFTQALQTLQPGQYYQQPVISQFGAHVVYLEDQRTVAPPTFEEAKEGIKRSLQERQISRFKQLLEVKADINTTP